MIRLEKIDAFGFKNLEIRDLTFPPEGNILIKGKNESGKSTLFEAIFFALTSELLVRDSRGYGDAIAFDKEAAEIDLEFQRNGIPARIRKFITKTGSGTSLGVDFWVNYKQDGEKHYSGSKLEVDPVIEEFVGFDADVLKNSSFVKQKGLDEFSGESRETRKKIVNKLLNLEKLTELRENFKAEFKELKVIEDYLENSVKIKKNKNLITDLNDKISAINKYRDEFDRVNKIYRNVIQNEENLRKISDEFKQIADKNNKNENNLKLIEEKRVSLIKNKENYEKIDDLRKRISLEEEKFNSLEKDKKSLTEALNQGSKEIEEYHRKEMELENLKLSLESNSKELNKFENWEKVLEEIERINNDLNSFTKDITNYNDRINEKQKAIKNLELDIQSKIKELIISIKDNITKIDELKEQNEENNSKIEKLSKIKKEYETFLKKKTVFNGIKQQLEIIKKDLENLKTRERDYEKKIKDKSELIEIIKDKKMQLITLRERIKDLKHQKEAYIRINGHNLEIENIQNQINSFKADISKYKEDKKEIEEQIRSKKDNSALKEKDQQFEDLIKERENLRADFYGSEKTYYTVILNIVDKLDVSKQFFSNPIFIISSIGSVVGIIIFTILSLIFSPFFSIGAFLCGIFLIIMIYRDYTIKKSKISDISRLLNNIADHINMIPSYEEQTITKKSLSELNSTHKVKEHILNQINFLDNKIECEPDEILFSNKKYHSISQLYDLNNEIFSKSVELRKIDQDIEFAEREISLVKNEIQRNNEDLKILKDRKDEINKQITITSEKLAGLNDVLMKKDSDFNKLNIQKPEESLVDIERVIKEKSEQIIRIEENIKKSEEDINKLNTAINDININQIREKIEGKVEEINIRQKDLLEFENIRKDFISKYNPSEMNFEAIATDIEGLKTQKTESETNIKNIKQEIKSHFYKLGMDPDSYNMSDRKTVIETLETIEQKLDGVHNWTTIQDYNAHYSVYPIYDDFKQNLIEITSEFQKLGEQKELKEREVKKLLGLKESYGEKCPEEYVVDIEKFKDNFTSKKLTVESIKNKISDIEIYLSEKNLEDMVARKKNIVSEIENTEEKAKSIDDSIKNDKEKINGLKSQIPELDDKASLEEMIEDVDKDREKIIKKISENRTKVREMWNNFSNSLKKSLQDLTKLDELTINKTEFPAINQENIDDIEKVLKNTIKDLESKIETIKQNIFNLEKPESEVLDIENYYNKIIEAFNQEKGGLETSINTCKKNIEKIRRHRTKSKIIDSYEENIGDIEENLKECIENRRILETTIEILEEGEVEISQKVLPKTIEILSRILPILTADRYKDAKINDEYEIKLFDSKLGNYVDKKLFSGGTNDQIALAFRLAFAMATMKDDSSRESFIFLDEPIGFFDDERRDSLINFLTSGVISNKFAQRIVISNFLDIEQHFDYIIEIDNGRIIKQIVTGSLVTTEPSDHYIKPTLEGFLELALSDHTIEDGFCEDCFTLTNISENYIKSIQLINTNKNLDINIIPIFFNELKSGDNKSLNLQYHTSILDEDKIAFDAHIIYLKDEKEENRIQKLEYIPKIN